MEVKDNLLLSKYLNQYKKSPTSRVFAPLAESYRKLGLIDEAIQTLKEGLRYNRGYKLAYIILGHCYFDQEEYELAYKVLKPIAHESADNIMLQKIFGRTCIELELYEEALESFKYVLFLNPNDQEVAEQVQKLENDFVQDSNRVIKETEQEQWFSEDFSEKSELLSDELSQDPIEEAEDFDGWLMEKSSEDIDPDFVESFFNEPNIEADKKAENNLEKEDDEDQIDELDELGIDEPILEEQDIDDDPFENFKKEQAKSGQEILQKVSSAFDDFFENENSSDQNQDEDPSNMDEVEDVIFKEESAPLVTHTMIDIYISQKHYEKAKELLEQIIEQRPDDKSSQEKLGRVLAKINGDETTKVEAKQENPQILAVKKLEALYGLYLEGIKMRGHFYKS
jgi:tetratricopeptide (TPR) repeat protein